MKKIFLALAMFICSMGMNAQTQEIKSDYTRTFKIDAVCIDLNQNGEVDEGEYGMVKDGKKVYANIDYHHFGSAGNMLTFVLKVNDKSYRSNFNNVTFGKKDEIFFMIDSVGDDIARVSYDKEIGLWMLVVFNLSLLD